MKGQVQEEELDSCRAAGERRPESERDEGRREKPARVLPARFLDNKNRGTVADRPSMDE